MQEAAGLLPRLGVEKPVIHLGGGVGEGSGFSAGKSRQWFLFFGVCCFFENNQMLLLTVLFACQTSTDTATVEQETELVCVSYDFCCETLCEAEGQTTHYDEPDPCDCEEG